MGYNTGLIILNDAMGTIQKRSKEFVANLNEAMCEFHYRKSQHIDVPVGGDCNAATVFHQAHADVTGVYAIGGNCASNLDTLYNGGRHHDEKHQLDILKSLAAKFGYSLTKKRISRKA